MKLVAFAAACILTFATQSGCDKGRARSGASSDEVAQPSLPKELSDADDLLSVGQCEAALKKATAYAESHPKDAEGFLIVGDADLCVAQIARDERDEPTFHKAASEATRAYESAALLVPKDVRPLVSEGAAALVVGARQRAVSSLTAALELAPTQISAKVLLALAADAPEKLATLAEEVCAGRKPGAAPAVDPCPDNEACGPVVLLHDVQLGDKAGAHLDYPAGTFFQQATSRAGHVVVNDTFHTESRPGTGWVLTSMPTRGTRWQRQGGVGGARVLAKRIPDFPLEGPVTYGGPPEQAAAHEKALAAQRRWSEFSRYEAWEKKGVPLLEEALGVVDDVVAGSVKAKGPDIRVEAKFNDGFATGVRFFYTFTPVTYQVTEFPERVFSAGDVASAAAAEAGPVAASKCLSDEEKRAILAKRPFEGAPLLQLLEAGAKLGEPRYELHRGVLTLRWKSPPSEIVAVDGVLTKVVTLAHEPR